jgi:uncharacterized phage protein (TIGR01671 family)
MNKFRAWDKGTELMNDITVIDLENEEIYYHHWRYGHSEAISFKDVELLQSTGLKDKNRTEIFVGDILEYEMVMGFGWYENGKDVVVYDENELKIKMKYRNENSLNRVVAIGCEVIGNIYQHPHLLEE